MALTRALVPFMKERRWGRIIHISSIMGFSSAGGRNAYSATKSALLGLARASALDLGPFGITVNCIAPGPFLTDLPMSLLSQEKQDEFARGTALGRWGNPKNWPAPPCSSPATPAATSPAPRSSLTAAAWRGSSEHSNRLPGGRGWAGEKLVLTELEGRFRRLLTDLHHSRAARIRVAGGGAGGDAPDAQALALASLRSAPATQASFPIMGYNKSRWSSARSLDVHHLIRPHTLTPNRAVHLQKPRTPQPRPRTGTIDDWLMESWRRSPRYPLSVQLRPDIPSMLRRANRTAAFSGSHFSQCHIPARDENPRLVFQGSARAVRVQDPRE